MISAATQPNTVYNDAVWRLMIAYGSALNVDLEDFADPIGFYHLDAVLYHGNSLNVSLERTLDVATRLLDGATVNVDASTDPAQRTDETFAGTFATSRYSLTYLIGQVTLSDGYTTVWGVEFANTANGRSGAAATLPQMLTVLASAPTWDGARDSLIARIDASKDRFELGWVSALPL